MRSKSMLMIMGVMVLLAAFSAIGLVAAQEDTTAEPGFLGVRISPTDNDALITAVLNGYPAADAGLQVDDVITAVNGDAVTADTLSDKISSFSAGDTVTLSIDRAGELMDVDVTLAANDQVGAVFVRPGHGRGGFVGITVESTDDGLKITEIVEGSPAADAGLQVGDVITAANGETLNDVTDLRAALVTGETVTLDILRDGESVSIDVEPTAYSIGALRMGRQPMNLGFSLTDAGLTIDSLSEDSELYAAGLREGDLITAVNGESFDNSMGVMHQFMQLMTSEDPITLTVERDGESLDIEIDPGVLSGIFSGMPFSLDNFEGMMPFGNQIIPMPHGDFGFSFSGNQARLGVTFVTLDEQNAVEYDASATEGAYVVEVSAQSPADQAGLQAGDIITAVDGDLVDAEHTLSDRIYAYEPGDVITLDVLRGDETLQIEVTLTSAPQQSGMMPFGPRGGNGGRFNAPVAPSSPDANSDLFNFDAPEL